VSVSNGAKHLVAVVGAGPAGIYAAQTLANAGTEVLLFNRDIKPGGLAEYGIYHDKHKMKEGLRKQFREILAMPNIHYFGNVVVGQQGDLSLDDLRAGLPGDSGHRRRPRYQVAGAARRGPARRLPRQGYRLPLQQTAPVQ
jgi:NADPH-dependent glutamate synthase beta subunit-like oxidoreductase